MLMKDILIEEYKEVIDTVLKATNLPHNEESRYKVADLVVRSMGLTGSKEPSLCPVYLLAVAINEYIKSNAWPAKVPEFVSELQGLTKLPYSTIRSSIAKFCWNVPTYLKPKPKKVKAEPVTVFYPTPEPCITVNNDYANRSITADEASNAQDTEPTNIKLTENYHVVIDFGAFKITIERENNGK